MTRYAIGDIHGGANTFRALLDKINLSLEDRLYLLGDYIDRGPDSKGVLDVIMQLLADGYEVRPVRGNHEDMLLEAVTGTNDDFLKYWLEEWGDTLKSFGVSAPQDLPVRYLTLLDQLPYIRLEDDYVFVHAGLDLTAADPLTESSPTAMVWGGNAPFDEDKLQGRTLVTGHNIRPLPLIELSLRTNHILLDNGACTNMQPYLGNLLALNLETRALLVQPWCD